MRCCSGTTPLPLQDTDFVLALFGASGHAARDADRKCVHASAHRGQPSDLDGGGLRRSLSGWRPHERLSIGREGWASDERVLGTNEFVQQLLGESAGATVTPAQPAALIQPLVAEVCAHCGVAPRDLGSRSLRPRVLDARAALSYAAVMHHGVTFTAVAQQRRPLSAQYQPRHHPRAHVRAHRHHPKTRHRPADHCSVVGCLAVRLLQEGLPFGRPTRPYESVKKLLVRFGAGPEAQASGYPNEALLGCL